MIDAALEMAERAITFYDDNNGKITYWISGSNAHIEMNIELLDFPYVEGKGDPETQYVKDGELVGRPVMPLVIDGLNISNIPKDAVIYIDDDEYPLGNTSTTEVELDFPMPGAYKIKVVAFPYLDMGFTYENNPQA